MPPNLVEDERVALTRLQQNSECIDLKYLSDVLTKEQALAMLKEGREGVAERAAEMERDGYPVRRVGWGGVGCGGCW